MAHEIEMRRLTVVREVWILSQNSLTWNSSQSCVSMAKYSCCRCKIQISNFKNFIMCIHYCLQKICSVRKFQEPWCQRCQKWNKHSNSIDLIYTSEAFIVSRNKTKFCANSSTKPPPSMSIIAVQTSNSLHKGWSGHFLFLMVQEELQLSLALDMLLDKHIS